MLPLHPSARLRQPVVSLLVPLFHEERIADRLLSRLGRLKYPRALLDICLVVESDDVVTRKCLLRTSLPPHVRTIVVPPGSVRTKPRALNYALDNCHGSIIGVYDAEDAPCPDQIAHVVSRFAEAPADVACLQGRLSPSIEDVRAVTPSALRHRVILNFEGSVEYLRKQMNRRLLIILGGFVAFGLFIVLAVPNLGAA